MWARLGEQSPKMNRFAKWARIWVESQNRIIIPKWDWDEISQNYNIAWILKIMIKADKNKNDWNWLEIKESARITEMDKKDQKKGRNDYTMTSVK